MLNYLRSRWTIVCVIGQHLKNYFLGFHRDMRYQFYDSYKFLGWKFKLHVSGILLKLVYELLWGRTQNIMNFMDLVKFVLAREQRKER